MPKRNRNQRAQDRRIEEEWAALALKSGDDEDFEDDEVNYEPTAEDIRVADADDYDSDSGESAEPLTQDVREEIALNENLIFTSRDGKIEYSTQAIELPINRRSNVMRTAPGKFLLS